MKQEVFAQIAASMPPQADHITAPLIHTMIAKGDPQGYKEFVVDAMQTRASGLDHICNDPHAGDYSRLEAFRMARSGVEPNLADTTIAIKGLRLDRTASAMSWQRQIETEKRIGMGKLTTAIESGNVPESILAVPDVHVPGLFLGPLAEARVNYHEGNLGRAVLNIADAALLGTIGTIALPLAAGAMALRRK